MSEVASCIHTELAEKMKSSRVWSDRGSGPGRVAKRTQVVYENDVIEIRVKC